MSLLAELMSVDVLNLIGLLAVVFIGLPHGAMDGALAIHLGWMNRPLKAATFLLAYVGLAALVVGMWLVVPTVGFLMFLAISLFHFGRGDIVPRTKEHQVAEVMMRGGIVLAGISLFHRSEVDSIFEVLIGSDTAIVWLFLQVVGVLTLILIPVVFSRSHFRSENPQASKSSASSPFLQSHLLFLALQFISVASIPFVTSNTWGQCSSPHYSNSKSHAQL